MTGNYQKKNEDNSAREIVEELLKLQKEADEEFFKKVREVLKSYEKMKKAESN